MSDQSHGVQDDNARAEPRWPALIAVAAAGGLSLAVPPGLTLGPRWLFPLITGVLLVPTVLSLRIPAHRERSFRSNVNSDSDRW